MDFLIKFCPTVQVLFKIDTPKIAKACYKEHVVCCLHIHTVFFRPNSHAMCPSANIRDSTLYLSHTTFSVMQDDLTQSEGFKFEIARLLIGSCQIISDNQKSAVTQVESTISS